MKKYKNLEKELDLIFGIFSSPQKDRIINAVEKDFQSFNKVSTQDSSVVILDIFNSIFNKKSRVVTKKVANKYTEILKYYSIDDIREAMSNAKEDDFHKENSYKYCTLEYFSRLEQIDKWINAKHIEQKSTFVAPKFNLKE
jgi:hypothetical protein